MADLTTTAFPIEERFQDGGDNAEIAEGCLGKGIIDDLPQRKILLTKGSSGLGFNIRGGMDAPYVKLDKGKSLV